MRILLLCCMLSLATPVVAIHLNLPAGSLGPDMVVQTRLGPMPNVIVSAPPPVVPRTAMSGRGVYAIDITFTSGFAHSVRVLQSSGHSTFDNAARDALMKWQFRQRLIYKLIVPIRFDGAKVTLGAP